MASISYGVILKNYGVILKNYGVILKWWIWQVKNILILQIYSNYSHYEVTTINCINSLFWSYNIY